MGKEAREKKYGETKRGNPVLGDYDCVIWTGDALRALSKEGLIDLRGKDPGLYLQLQLLSDDPPNICSSANTSCHRGHHGKSSSFGRTGGCEDNGRKRFRWSYSH